jgi:molybdate transport repressor ModE-like protein
MAYRTAWLLVQEINNRLRQPAVSTKNGGVKRSGAVVTPVGEKVIELYHSIEGTMCASAHQEFQAIAALVRNQATHSIATQQRTLARRRTAAELQVEAKITKGPEQRI